MSIQFEHNPKGDLVGTGPFKFRHYGVEVGYKVVITDTSSNNGTKIYDGYDSSSASRFLGTGSGTYIVRNGYLCCDASEYEFAPYKYTKSGGITLNMMTDSAFVFNVRGEGTVTLEWME